MWQRRPACNQHAVSIMGCSRSDRLTADVAQIPQIPLRIVADQQSCYSACSRAGTAERSCGSQHLLTGRLLASRLPVDQLHVVLEVRVRRHSRERKAACRYSQQRCAWRVRRVHAARQTHAAREQLLLCRAETAAFVLSEPTFCPIAILRRDAELAALALPHGGNAKVQALAAQPRSCRAGKPLPQQTSGHAAVRRCTEHQEQGLTATGDNNCWLVAAAVFVPAAEDHGAAVRQTHRVMHCTSVRSIRSGSSWKHCASRHG
jgi:hypothetical protein